MIKIQSVSDLITNSSTEVFVIYDESAIKGIKELVTSIISLNDSSKTFDDYFDVELCVNYDSLYYVLNDSDIKEPEAIKYREIEDWKERGEYMESIPKERVEELFNIYNATNWDVLYPYEGINVIAKVDDPIVNKVASVIAGIGNIFELDYSQS